MKEIGGYIELDRYCLPMLYENAVHLNCGRNALAYLIEARSIKKIAIPYFLCDSVKEVCRKYAVVIRFYHISSDFKLDDRLALSEDEWLYIVNYYGQYTPAMLQQIKEKYQRVIVDNAQAYFESPLDDIDTIYTCRKFFGVADGAILFTSSQLGRELPLDESYERMHFLLGRFERTASEFYHEYAQNNSSFAHEPLKRMSRLTENLLHGIDYNAVKKRRTENYNLYSDLLHAVNELNLRGADGAFAYPLLVKNGAAVRKELQRKKIYIPTLWPDVMHNREANDIERYMAENILPLPCDQRYDEDEVKLVAESVVNCYGLIK